MSDNVFDVVTKQAVDGTKQAVDTMNGIFKTPKDPEVRVYNQLKPADFEKISQQFGSEATMEYIRRMETKLQKP